MTRKKLPAYGAALRDGWRRGHRALCVHLLYGYDWRANPACWWSSVSAGLPAMAGEHPKVAVKPDDYVPGVFDFGVLKALQVCVFDQVGEAGYREDPDLGPVRPHYSRFWFLLSELGAVAADVEVYSPAFDGIRWSAHELARMQRGHGCREDASMNHGWPFWWSAAIDENNAKRRVTWCGVVFSSEVGFESA